MTFTSNGNVGIGTATPSFKLDVSGTGRLTGPGGDGTNGTLLLTGSDIYGHSLYVASSTGTQKRMGFNHNGTIGNIFAYNYGSSTPQNLILQYPGGNVGIITTSPSALLDIAGGSDASGVEGSPLISLQYRTSAGGGFRHFIKSKKINRFTFLTAITSFHHFSSQRLRSSVQNHHLLRPDNNY